MMNKPLPVVPPLSRGTMQAMPWAGHPLLRLLRRLMGYRTPRSWVHAGERRTPMLRRLLLLALVATGAVIGTQTMLDVLPSKGATVLEQAVLILFGVLFAWISAGFWTALMGARALLLADRHAISRVLKDPQVQDQPIAAEARTAIIMPICNEHVATVFAGLRATWESLQATGEIDRFEFFVLSDTNDPDIRVAEQVAWTGLVHQLGLQEGSAGAIHYRWRSLRTKRKAGNVADFCRRWGHDYRYMVVLDADSVMTGLCLTNLVRLMEAHPDAGIIQSAPRALGHDTLHARAQQFGSRVYGPLFTAGMHFWQLGESHYWGHNAILRVAPFMQHCALPPIRGKGSLSGEILSHDFVEAALMRRAGWKVWVAWDLDGSYEQLPPNFIAEVQRDRRWCQGNLQNSRLIFEPGLHPVHRAIFATGLLAYLSAPLWLGFLLLSTLLFSSTMNTVPQYFIESYQLFPLWPTVDRHLVLSLFGATAMLLFAPKVIAILTLVLRGRSGRYGGPVRLIASAVIELLLSVAMAPVRMMFHCQFVLAALTGWRIEWRSPPREGEDVAWREAWRRHGSHTVFAVVWCGALLSVGASFPWWLIPTIGGLLMATPLSVWTSRASIGQWMQRHGLLVIPEELQVPLVVLEAKRYMDKAQRAPRLVDAVVEPAVHEAVLAAIPNRPKASGLKAVAQNALAAQAALMGPHHINTGVGLRLLADAGLLAELRLLVLTGRAHPDWRNSGGSGGATRPLPALAAPSVPAWV